MNFAVVLFCLIPFVMNTSMNERFIEVLLVPYDFVAIAKQLLAQFGSDMTYGQCETQFCPQIVDKIDGHNTLITTLACAAVCKEAMLILAG
ncbi:hypothetical protein DPMN_143176 [Dreissena polymorpha]|uniref:Uncharacterized protein n=1 Tax=Dreissena polymorpha TaxID=45954 RepID=A0A9D4JJU5_DREPO|nr:hypothetical protein DPMN_143176 [Dreissena polymorpha]